MQHGLFFAQNYFRAESSHADFSISLIRTVSRLSGQCLIIGIDPGPVWETARLFPAFTQHTLSLSRPSSPRSWRLFSGPGDFFPNRNKSGFVEA